MKERKFDKIKEPGADFRLKHKVTFRLIHLMLASVPFIAGCDKFFNFITDWQLYVSPILKPLIPMSPKNIMRCAGVAEVGVGVLTAIKPRLGSTLFSIMLLGIIVNLLTMRKQLHIASLDFCLAAFSTGFALLLPDSEKL